MRYLAPVAALLLGMSLPSPAQAWDWRPPPGDPVIDLSAIDRLPERHALIALAGLRHTVANLPLDTDLTGLDHGLTFLGAMLFDTNRDPLMVSLRALRLEMALRWHGEDSIEYASALLNLKGPYGFGPFDYAAAEAPVREALAIARRHEAALEPLDLMGFVTHAAFVFSQLGQHDEAAALLREYLQYWRGQDVEPIVLKPRIRDLARELAAAGQDDEAAALFDEALQITRETRAHRTQWLGLMGELAAVQDRRDPARALVLRQEMVAILEQSLQGADPGNIGLQATRRAELGDVLALKGEIARASALHLEALSIMREARGDDHHDTFRQAHRALAHLRHFDPGNPALGEVADLSARDPWRNDD